MVVAHSAESRERLEAGWSELQAVGFISGQRAGKIGRYEVAGVRGTQTKEPSGEITFISSVLNP